MPSVATCPDLSRYQQLATGSLAEADEVALLAHLEHCEACARKLNGLNEPDALASLLRQARVSQDEAEQGRVARLIARLSKLRPGDTSAVQRDETQVPQTPDAILPCPSCGQAIKVKPEWAGQQVRCPLCQHVVRVPAGSAEASRAGNQTSPWLNPAARGVVTIAYQPPAKQSYDFLAPPQAPDEIGRLGGYRVLDVLGAGGMGVVFRAEDLQLARPVALKTMLPSLAANESAQQRFLREARAAAMLRHDHIVIIHQVGEDRGVPFLAMEFLNGEPLDMRLARERKLPVAEVLRIGREIALGLAAAHKRNLIHRDIKPANIWLDAETGRVKILDFGLARASGEGTQLTQHGAILGTPAYMAPEQARGKTLDHRCDLFSLGCVLYRMATGKPAFQGSDIFSTLLAVTTEEPPAPRQLDAALPAALSDLIVKLLAKEPEDRPASAQAVAEALQEIGRALSQPPVSVVPSHPPASGQPAPRRKRPFFIGVAACVVFVLLAGLLAGIALRVQTRDGTIVLEDLPADAEVLVNGNKVKLKLADDGKAFEVQVTPGKQTLTIKAPGFAMETKDVTLAAGDRKPFRVHLQPLAGAAAKTPVPSKKGDASAEFVAVPGPSAALEAMRREQIPRAALALAGNGDPMKAPPSLVGVLGNPQPFHTSTVLCVAFSPDGRWLASGSEREAILLRDVKTGNVIRQLKAPGCKIVKLAFGKDSQTLVAACDSNGYTGTIKIWSLDKEAIPQSVQPKFSSFHGLAVSKDGRFLAAVGYSGAVKLWKWGEWDSPKELISDEQKDWVKFPYPRAALAFSPDGELLAVGLGNERRPENQSIRRIYSTTNGKVIATFGDGKGIPIPRGIAFSGDGKYLACHLQNVSRVEVWETASWKRIATLPGIFWGGAVAFSPDVKTLAVAGPLWVRIDDLATKKRKRVLPGAQWCGPLAFSPDGKLLAAGAQVWETTTWKQMYLERGHRQNVLALAVSPDGSKLLSAGNDDTLRVWDLGHPGTNDIVHRFHTEYAHEGGTVQGPLSVAYSPTGKMFALLVRGNNQEREYDERAMIAWDAATVKERWTVKEMMDSVVFSPDGNKIAGACRDGTVRLWDADSGTEVFRFPAIGRCPSVSFSTDGKHLAAVSSDKNCVKVWDVARGIELHSWQDSSMTAVTFHPKALSLATGHKDGTIGIWNLAEGKKTRTLRGHLALVSAVRFTPDGKTLVSCGHDGTIRMWNPELELPQRVIALGPSNQRLTMDLDASGRYVFAAGHGPLIYVLRIGSAARK